MTDGPGSVDWIVRPATGSDIAGMVALSESVTSEKLAWFRDQPESEASLRDLLAHASMWSNSVVLVAEQRSEIIGDLACGSLGPNLSEFAILVHREHRQVGVGSKLLGALVDWAESHLRFCRLQAKVVEPNEDSIRLLERFGFSRLSRPDQVSTIRGVGMPEFLYYRDFRRGYTTATSTSK